MSCGSVGMKRCYSHPDSVIELRTIYVCKGKQERRCIFMVYCKVKKKYIAAKFERKVDFIHV